MKLYPSLLLGIISLCLMNTANSWSNFKGYINNYYDNYLNFPSMKNIYNLEWRTIDGTGNNQFYPLRGSAGQPLIRLSTQSYQNGTYTPAGASRPSPRYISNELNVTATHKPNQAGASDFFWQWAQFLDHDLDLTGGTNEFFNIDVPEGDLYFDPMIDIPFTRSTYDNMTGVRQQLNEITAFIDASNVYGSDLVRASALRTNDGTGQLATSADNYLPYNEAGLTNAPNNSSHFYLAGDVRANEQLALLAMHTLFVREHNSLASAIQQAHPEYTGDEVYEIARLLVGAEMQAITYNEFLPILLGKYALSEYQGYNPEIDPTISNMFSTMAYRFGHSAISPTLLRLDSRYQQIEEGDIALKDVFFSPKRLTTEGGIEPLLRGLAAQTAQEVDLLLVDGIRNFLFGEPGAGGTDLASLNIQRGRDHGLPSYNQLRADVGLAQVTSFDQITSDPKISGLLSTVYANDINEVDAWIGALTEDHVSGAMVGPLFYTILKSQFEALRDGDRFFYKYYLPSSWVRWVEDQTLSTIIQRNTTINFREHANVFLASDKQPIEEKLRYWCLGTETTPVFMFPTKIQAEACQLFINNIGDGCEYTQHMAYCKGDNGEIPNWQIDESIAMCSCPEENIEHLPSSVSYVETNTPQLNTN